MHSDEAHFKYNEIGEETESDIYQKVLLQMSPLLLLVH